MAKKRIKNEIIRKEDCGGKLPVCFTKIKKDGDSYFQYLMFYGRKFGGDWEQYYEPILSRDYEEMEEKKEVAIGKVKEEVGKFDWAESIEHPDYPIVYI